MWLVNGVTNESETEEKGLRKGTTSRVSYRQVKIRTCFVVKRSETSSSRVHGGKQAKKKKHKPKLDGKPSSGVGGQVVGKLKEPAGFDVKAKESPGRADAKTSEWNRKMSHELTQTKGSHEMHRAKKTGYHFACVLTRKNKGGFCGALGGTKTHGNGIPVLKLTVGRVGFVCGGGGGFGCCFGGLGWGCVFWGVGGLGGGWVGWVGVVFGWFVWVWVFSFFKWEMGEGVKLRTPRGIASPFE